MDQNVPKYEGFDPPEAHLCGCSGGAVVEEAVVEEAVVREAVVEEAVVVEGL